MARYTGPTTRISRRFGTHILGSGKAFERRAYPPGVHGAKMRRKVSEYAVGLNEKQKLRYIYGLLERQFRRVFEIAKKERGVTGERFLQLLETRLDSVVYLLGLAKSRAAARQFVTRCLEENRVRNVPGWLTMNAESFKAVVNRLPTREEMEQGINEQL